MRAAGLVVAALAVIVTIVAVTLRTQGQRPEAVVQPQGVAERAQKTTLRVPDMFCAGCEVGVKIAANKVDLKKADVKKIEAAFPQYPVIGISAESGDNVDELYQSLVRIIK